MEKNANPTYYMEFFPVGAFQCNCIVVVNEASRQAMIVDPGDEPDLILAHIEGLGVEVRGFWHTHAHLDHLGATRALWEKFSERARKKGEPLPEVYLHPEDRWLYENVALQSALLGLPSFEVPPTFASIRHRQNYEIFPGLQALHTPGHTPGSCCLNVASASTLQSLEILGKRSLSGDGVLLSGDTLFRRSIGRTDLWGGDAALIARSIRERLYALAPDTVVIPGHGPVTSIEEEQHKNPFVR